jgi:hypothetical protein
VWKSTDGGTTLVSAWSDDLPQSMGALAIAPNGTLYAGTGEPDHGGGGSATAPACTARPTARAGHRFGEHRRSRPDPDRSHQPEPDLPRPRPVVRHRRRRGLYLSEDGGDSRRQVLAGLND